MKGQHLFVRPIDASDDDAVRAFLARHASAKSDRDRPSPISCGLIGKLVGDLVAVLSMEVSDDAVRLDDLIVAEELRRKRIGRVMLNELDVLAAKMDRKWIVVDAASHGEGAREFLRHVGFVDEGGRMVRRVR